MTRRTGGVLRRTAQRLPATPQETIRRAALGWGMATASWRARPDLIVVGAQRCGTTTLFRLLSAHPDIVRPPLNKGVGYFDTSYSHGSRWYAAHFPLRRSGRLAFESSGYYLFHPEAATRIAADLPGVRVVAMVRDPVDRAYSAHAHELRRGYETEPFERALELEESRLAGEVERLRADPTYESFEHRHHGYLARGRYAEQLERFRTALGPENVEVLDPWRGADGFATEWARLLDWLGLRQWEPDEFAAWNAAPRQPMEPDLRERLRRYYEPYDVHLERITGVTPSWRA